MSAWDTFLDEVAAAQEAVGLKADDDCFFRGHGDCEWPLLPTLLRHRLSDEKLHETESDLFFGARGDERRSPCVWVLNPFRLNEEWGSDIVAPRNLGWDADEEQYYDYGELLLENEPYEWTMPVAVYPNKNNPRLFAQRGYFTLHGQKLKPLDQLAPRDACRRVLLPRTALPTAQRYLDMFGVDEYQVYGSLDALANTLRRRYLGG